MARTAARGGIDTAAYARKKHLSIIVDMARAWRRRSAALKIDNVGGYIGVTAASVVRNIGGASSSRYRRAIASARGAHRLRVIIGININISYIIVISSVIMA